MKYPVVLFFRWDKYNQVDSKIEQYKSDDKFKPMRWRSWFSYGLPKWFIDFSRKYF